MSGRACEISRNTVASAPQGTIMRFNPHARLAP